MYCWFIYEVWKDMVNVFYNISVFWIFVVLLKIFFYVFMVKMNEKLLT